jgi:hypothetical protein
MFNLDVLFKIIELLWVIRCDLSPLRFPFPEREAHIDDWLSHCSSSSSFGWTHRDLSGTRLLINKEVLVKLVCCLCSSNWEIMLTFWMFEVAIEPTRSKAWGQSLNWVRGLSQLRWRFKIIAVSLQITSRSCQMTSSSLSDWSLIKTKLDFLFGCRWTCRPLGIPAHLLKLNLPPLGEVIHQLLLHLLSLIMLLKHLFQLILIILGVSWAVYVFSEHPPESNNLLLGELVRLYIVRCLGQHALQSVFIQERRILKYELSFQYLSPTVIIMNEIIQLIKHWLANLQDIMGMIFFRLTSLICYLRMKLRFWLSGSCDNKVLASPSRA